LPKGVLELESFGRFFYQVQNFQPYAEVLGRFEDTSFEFRYRSLTLGSYYRPIPNLKVGLFYRLQAGARHNDDWIEMPTPSGWGWRDTRGRYESVAIGDVSPRFILGFIDRNLVFMLKNRFEYNFFNRQASLFVRPGLTWFLLSDREPRAEISLQYAVYFALNFGETPVYSNAPYLEVLYHLTPNLQLVGGLSYLTERWSTSSDANIWGSGHYVVDYTAFRIQAGVVYTLRAQ
ncbi:MAG TPA: hypothetical protein VMW87_04830, partial [Spirochaetia bacterium]|nr:hypothetical protein [Spirochaetia bacterium]